MARVPTADVTIGRRRPYTERGIRRVACQRCGRPAVHQWSICALDNRYVGICAACDIELNALVLRFMNVPDARAIAARYAGRSSSE